MRIVRKNSIGPRTDVTLAKQDRPPVWLEISGVRPDPSCPVDLGDLTYGEHLVVWAFRAFARGRDCMIVRREFDYVCGERGAEAFGAMRVFVQQLSLLGRRSIVLPAPGCPVLTRDEQRVLCLFAAAQAGEGGGFAAQFRGLAGAAYDSVAEKAVQIVVEAMAQRGYRFRSFAKAGPRATAAKAPAGEPVVRRLRA